MKAEKQIPDTKLGGLKSNRQSDTTPMKCVYLSLQHPTGRLGEVLDDRQSKTQPIG